MPKPALLVAGFGRRIFKSYYGIGGVGVGVGVTAAHRTRIKMEWNWLAARNVKSTGRAGLITEKLTTTGLNVPGTNGGMFTIAFIGTPTNVIDCVPVPVLTWSMVTVPGPLPTLKEAKPPGIKFPSVTVVDGVQTLPPGVGVGVGVGVEVGVGVGVGVVHCTVTVFERRVILIESI
jgi:hypothetical protein